MFARHRCRNRAILLIMERLKIALAGAGRMGCALVQELHHHPELELCAVLESPSSPHIGKDAGILAHGNPAGIAVSATPRALESLDALIDFSTPKTCVSYTAHTAGKIHVIGVTGFSSEQDEKIRRAAKNSVIVKSANFSLGIHVLRVLVERAATVLDSWDVGIVDKHHRHKKDAPSGTSFLLAQGVAQKISFSSLRMGEGVGSHTVIFESRGETLVLEHTAQNRRIFAHGALSACVWARGQNFGFYTLSDVLGDL